MTALPAYATAARLLDDCRDGAELLAAARALRDSFVRGDHIIGLLPIDAPQVLDAVYRRAGENGQVDAWLELGDLLSHGAAPHAPYPPRDLPASIESHRRADALGSVDGALGWIRTAYFARSEQHAAAAAARVDELVAAHPHDPRVLLLKGYMTHQGYGFPADRTKAVEWHLRSAENDGADGAFELSVLYGTGDGVDRDSDASLRWTVRAAELGSVRAMSNLGGMYATGRGVPHDPDTALEWYGRAADNGHAQAAYTAGVMHLVGDGGIPIDEDRAATFFATAETLGFDVDGTLSSMGLDRPRA